MRNLLQKIPPSGPRSMPQRAALLSASAPSAAKRRRAAPYTGVPRVRVAVEENPGEDVEPLAARLRLLEGFVGRSELADTAYLALQWLGEVLGISQSICLVRPADAASPFVVGTYGLVRSGGGRLLLAPGGRGDPPVSAFFERPQIFFPRPPA